MSDVRAVLTEALADDGQVWQLDFGAVNRRAKGYAQAERVR